MKFYAFLQGAWFGRKKPIEEVYADLIEEACYAEELGYDGVLLAEQNLVTFLATPDPIQIAAQIAMKTTKLRLGIGVFVLPFHHPLRLAGEVAQLDVLTGGRLDVGVGRGASPFQLAQFQRTMDEEQSRRFFKEHLTIMTQHWSNADTDQSYDGEFFSYPSATVLPETVQRPYPPLWIATVSPPSTKSAVEMGFESNHMVSAFREPFSFVEDNYRAFEQGLAEIGRPREASKFAVNRMTYVAPTEEEANECLDFVVQGHRVVTQQVNTKDEKIKDGEYDTSQPVPGEPTPAEMANNLILGTPEVALERTRMYADLGVDTLVTWHHFGMPHDKVMRSMKLYAEHVMPHFKED